MRSNRRQHIEFGDYSRNRTLSGAPLAIGGAVALIPVASEVVGWINGAANGDAYREAIETVHGFLNWNECKNRGDSWCQDSWLPSFSEEYFTEAAVEGCLNTYINLVLSSNLPEYSDESLSDTQKQEIYRVIANKAILKRDFVGRVLKQLYWSTKDRRISTDAFLRPRTFRNNRITSRPDITKPQEKDCESGDLLCKLSKFLDTASTIVLVGGVVAAGVLLYVIIKDIQR